MKLLRAPRSRTSPRLIDIPRESAFHRAMLEFQAAKIDSARLAAPAFALPLSGPVSRCILAEEQSSFRTRRSVHRIAMRVLFPFVSKRSALSPNPPHSPRFGCTLADPSISLFSSPPASMLVASAMERQQ